MREIKFRAWDKQDEKMVNWDVLKIEKDKNGLFMWKPIDPEGRSHDGTEEFILMQYTGLKDKNGREIYEGDIILFGDFDYDGREFRCEGEVVFEDGCYHVTNAISESELFNHIDEYVEVIGNIYEDKHLLEVQP